ncbi:MAG: DUF1080 domain-containing protein, partial [Verrucomicrobiota bacterium]|jgi:hypothetical protein|nr:DUF1080 domain-containing protein [Verrucomicrobiota bacterium]
MLVVAAVTTVGAAFANPPNPKVEGDMYAVKKVEGKPDFAKPPSGAEVLFDGTQASAEANWVLGKPVEKGGQLWPIKDGVWIDTANDLLTKKEYGSVRLHLEWRIPSGRETKGQKGANSGIIFMPQKGFYEVQILESHSNGGNTYSDGMAGAVYQRSTPSSNPAMPQGEWQSYDITFLAPKFGADGAVERKPTFTVVFNGVTVQDAVEIDGPTLNRTAALSPHPVRQPIKFQYHNDPIEFRNIWLQELAD